jgi:hypothetical protein
MTDKGSAIILISDVKELAIGTNFKSLLKDSGAPIIGNTTLSFDYDNSYAWTIDINYENLCYIVSWKKKRYG